MWVRADLRQRWRSWIVLGLLAGLAFGVAAAAVAGARRTAEAVPRYVRANGSLDAAVLANSPAFDARVRGAVARLPEVRGVFPLAIPLAIEVIRPRGLQSTTIPTTAHGPTTGVLVDGRAPDPRRADEAVVDETTQRRFGMGIGSTIVVRQSITPEEAAAAPPGLVPAGADLNYTARLRVVGISKAVSSDADWTPSSGFWRKYGPRTPAFVNMFVGLRNGDADFDRFQADVQRVAHQTINVERAGDILGTRKAQSVTGVEEDGLLIFALAALVGGAVLVGQALVRAVTAGAADLPTWRAIGADRRIVVRAMALPALITALVGAVTGVVVAIAISSRFPIGVARRYELDLGTHADWLVLAGAALALVVLVLGAAWLAAEWRIARREHGERARSGLADMAARLGLPPAFTIGSRLAVERGRGHRAVPVRSALVGAVVGVIGVVGCLTFRAGIDDAVSTPGARGSSGTSPPRRTPGR